MKTKSQQAQEYAEKQRLYASISGDGTSWLYTPKQFVNAFIDGYTAAEQSMWRSVEEELPEMEDRVLICEKLPNNQLEIFIDRRLYFMDSWDWGGARKENVVAWCPLPKYIPETNTEKRYI